MTARAEARYIRVSPQKARLVVDMIRGQKAGSAILTLQTVNKRIAPTVEKVLKSAIANARNASTDVDVDNLVVSEAYVNEGPRQKRVRPAPMGRAFRYVRRMAHIVIVLGERTSKSAEVKGEAKGGATKAATGAKPAKAKAGAAAKNKKKPAARNWEKATR